MRVLQLGFRKALVVIDGTIADQLNLWDSRNCLQVGVKNRLAVLLGFVVAVAVGVALGIKRLWG